MKRFSILFAILLALICIPYITSAQEDGGGQGEGAEIPEADESDAVEITDTNLASAIRSTLGLDTDAEITASDMLNLTSLQAKDAGISDLSGLAHATHLTTLNLASNSISDLSPLKDLLSLNHLDLYSNQVTDLGSLSRLESLTSLEVGKNVITDIEALGDLTSLTSLYLDDNKLTDFSDLSSLTGLSVLSLSRTGISDLSALEKLTTLTQLYLTGNEISSITALSKLPKLGWLFLAQNQISDVSPLVGLESLMSLRLLGNPVSDASLLYPLTQGGLIDVDIEIPPPSDTDPPSVVITVPTTAQNGAFDVTITFSEAVSGFEQSDLSISGTATATVTAWSTTDDTVFTATITPTRDGEMMLSVAAGVATDAANNNNTAVETQMLTVDMTSPGVSLSVPADAQNSAFEATITFTEVVSGFVQADFSLGGTATVSITAWTTTDNTVWTATLTPTTSGTLTLSIAAGAVTDTAGNTNVLSTAEVNITLNVDDAFVSVCDRTTEVRNAIVAALPNVSKCADVTAADLATIKGIDIPYENITALKEGDFNGLTALTRLYLYDNDLSSLPAGIFDDLTALEKLSLSNNDLSSLPAGIFDDLTALEKLWLSNNDLSSLPADIFDDLIALEGLYLGNNDLSSLPAGIFDDLTALTQLSLSDNDLSSLHKGVFEDLTALEKLWLDNNDLSSLPAGIFDDLTALKVLYLYDNDLSSLPAGIFDDLTALTELNLYNNDLSSLPEGIFEGLTALKRLYLDNNDLSSLPAGIFDDLTALEVLYLYDNDLSSLPAGIFDDLTALARLYLYGNTVDPLSLTVSLKQIEAGQFKVTVPTGAPFNVSLTLRVTNGSIDEEATAPLTISRGRVESETLTVSRAPGTTDAVLVDIETLPPIPGGHSGYELVKSADLPLTVIDALGNAAPRRIPVDAVPSETVLSANYPNPFNPETWIPYQLSNTSDVKITIYDMRGTVVRRLDLGHQRAGYYTRRSRAAYWDGRNNRGERVASGIYFYQFEAENVSLLRKMVILK